MNCLKNSEMVCNYSALLASPPCNMFTRVQFANDFGPKPCRTNIFPRGLPNLSKLRSRTVELGNILADCTFDAVEAILVSDGAIFVEFPEDLGAVPNCRLKGVRPSSLWQWPAFWKLLQNPLIKTVGLRQCDFGTDYVKPTRLLLNNSFSISSSFRVLHFLTVKVGIKDPFLLQLENDRWCASLGKLTSGRLVLPLGHLSFAK